MIRKDYQLLKIMKIHFFLFWGALGLKPWAWLMLGKCPVSYQLTCCGPQVIRSNRTAKLDKIKKIQTRRKAERSL